MNGTGTLTLNGSAVNTYTGATTINSGTLLEDFSNLSSPTNLIDSGRRLVLGGGTLRINGNASSATSQTFAGLAINPGASTISLAPTGGLTDTLGFTNNTTITRATGATLNFAIPANGAVNLNPTLAAGIVGPWATIGSGGAIQYAMTSSGAIAAYTYLAVPAGNQGTAIASAASITDTSGTVNYSLSAAGSGTAGASASINTLQYTGSGLTLAPGSGGLTANGIMNVGNGTLTIQTNSLIIGSNGGTNNELVITGPGNDTISSLITNNGSGASALTVASTGTVTLNALNAFTGGTFVNAGTLTLPTSTNSPIGDIRGALDHQQRRHCQRQHGLEPGIRRRHLRQHDCHQRRHIELYRCRQCRRHISQQHHHDRRYNQRGRRCRLRLVLRHHHHADPVHLGQFHDGNHQLGIQPASERGDQQSHAERRRGHRSLRCRPTG